MVSDAYILGLVASATPCFSFYNGSGECTGCMLTDQCKAILEERTGRMVLTLQTKRALEAKKLEASAKKEEPKKTKGDPRVVPVVASGSPDESIDDILASIDVNPPKPANPPASMTTSDFDTLFGLDSDLTSFFDELATVPTTVPTTVTTVAEPVQPAAPVQPVVPMVKVVSDSSCFSCQKGIPKNTSAAFFPGKGLAHPECVPPGDV